MHIAKPFWAKNIFITNEKIFLMPTLEGIRVLNSVVSEQLWSYCFFLMDRLGNPLQALIHILCF